MSDDDVYSQDILVWSERQAELLRRVARGERVNGVDWDHVIEEIEDVGSSELHSVQSLLGHGMVHLLKSAAWPNAQPREHWRSEVTGFLVDVERRFTPSMRQKIDLEREYCRAMKQVRTTTIDGRPPGPLPERCPFTLDALLAADRDELEAQLDAALNASGQEPTHAA
ncbi:MAG TPA: DUF29 domain-containing protein [Acetobacteraceae bacterium]|nr:DUF29 domain-containing protein [Acetobacteraceae bacterium]